MRARDLYKQISTILQDYDAQVLQGLIDSIPARRAAVEAVRARRAEYTGKDGSYRYGAALVDAAGGKGWSTLLSNGPAIIIAHLRKTEAAKVAARNAKIAAKLAKVSEVAEITDVREVRSPDGFTGRWTLGTDAGNKVVHLQVILAGGYNIQCLHQRVLVNIS